MATSHPQSTFSETAVDRPSELPDRLVLFDGTCGLCERTVQTLLRRDRDRLLRYAPLQGTTAATLRNLHPDRIPEGLDSVVYIDNTGPRIEIAKRSRAARRILEVLGDSPAALTVLKVTPEFVADAFYRVIAACRYRIFGRIEQCAIPDPEDQALFLD